MYHNITKMATLKSAPKIEESDDHDNDMSPKDKAFLHEMKTAYSAKLDVEYATEEQKADLNFVLPRLLFILLTT